MKDLHETLNDLLGHSTETEKFFTHAVTEKQQQIQALKEGMLVDIDHVKERAGWHIANAERELENLYTWAKALGLKQVLIDTGGMENKKNGTR